MLNAEAQTSPKVVFWDSKTLSGFKNLHFPALTVNGTLEIMLLTDFHSNVGEL